MCLALEMERSITSEEVVATLERLFIERGAPEYIRSDNGPEFIAEALKRWLAVSGVGTLYIEPGSPWENAYSETFISRLRDELLNTQRCLPICWKRRFWPVSTENTTTRAGRMERWGISPRQSLRRRKSSS